jgi:hypothetical protein
VGFSKVIPANGTGKTEYSNTPQGLPGFGYNLARNYAHEGIVRLWVYFQLKSNKEYELFSKFSFIF